ncbi:MAG: hypothetical protein ACI9FB_001084 [Candidatus Azotimanducaceae bacterium]|jgi:hypothetical protein
MNDRDKRTFFRLSDPVEVNSVLVSKSDVTDREIASFFDYDANFHIQRELHDLEVESKEILRGITKADRQLGSFLSNLNKRIELLGKALSTSNKSIDARYDDVTQVSEGGISFVSQKIFNEGDHLALKLVFHPTLLGLLSFVHVKHCRLLAESHEYRIGAEFINLSHHDQRLLARHIIQRQSEERRARLRKGGH